MKKSGVNRTKASFIDTYNKDMKARRIIICFLILSLAGVPLIAQYIPGGINYQAVARDHLGNELKNRNIIVRISIISENPTGEIEYSENHGVTTDIFGLFNLVIGQGSWYSGSKAYFDEIEWGLSPHFLKVEVDFGEGFLSMGTMQFLAVPYALHAGTAANSLTTLDYQQLSFDQQLKELSLEHGGTVDLSSLIPFLDYKNGVLSLTNSNSVTIDIRDADSDPANEFQELTYNNYEVSISNRNKVNLIDLLQDLQLSQDHILKITKNATSTELNLRPYLDNTDNQILRIEGDSLAISGGNKVKVDLSDTNEIQDLNLNGNTLKVTGKADATLVDLSKYLDNLDEQTLSLTGDSLAISGGNKVKVDLSDTNEIQDLQLTDNILKITGNPSAHSVDLSGYMDNTDKQQLALEGFNLSITDGGTVNIRPEVIAFRAKRTGGNPITPGDSTFLEFIIETIDEGTSFEFETGKFTVPPGGNGLYRVDIQYKFSDGHQLKLYKNDNAVETILENMGSLNGIISYNNILFLQDGDILRICLKNNSLSPILCSPAIFSAYRIH